MPALRIVASVMVLAGLSIGAAGAQPAPKPAAKPAPAQAPVQAPAQAPAPAQPPGPYKPVTITLAPAMKDAGLEALRGQLAEATKKRDQAALGRLVVAKGFFWDRPDGDGANKQKSGAENLVAALGLANKDGAGWDILASYADEPSAAASPEHKDAVCAPAEPKFDGNAFGKLLDSTQSDVSDWVYPVSAGVPVLSAPKPDAAVAEKLGLHFVRIIPEAVAGSAAYLRVVTPSGKPGFVSIDSIAPIGNDEICYVKEGGAWKIGGYIGGGEAQ